MKSEVKITGNQMQITRVFDAPRTRVFAAWAQRDLLQRWTGCKDTTKVELEMDFRVGGTFTQKMNIKGVGDYSITGQYDEIIEPEKIVYHVNLGPATSRVMVEFIEQGNQTKVVLTQDGFPDPNLCKMVSQGTMEALDKLEQSLAGQPV
ncbi:MAG TPA: SRPBCC domain-containing protein [Candidatus Angelobacter sp.]|nr:SRPBCC domain-containing protein [Candidatus Angelobacter sp.]